MTAFVIRGGHLIDPAAGVGPFLVQRGHHHGVILRPLGDSIAFCPPLIINESEIDLMFQRFALALEDTLAMVRERGFFETAAVPVLAK